MVLAEQPPEFVVCWIALVALGLFLGWFSCYFLPWSWYLRDERRLTEEELRAQHPGKAWVTLPPWLLPIICGLVTIVLIIGKVAHTGESSLLEAFFLPL